MKKNKACFYGWKYFTMHTRSLAMHSDCLLPSQFKVSVVLGKMSCSSIHRKISTGPIIPIITNTQVKHKQCTYFTQPVYVHTHSLGVSVTQTSTLSRWQKLLLALPHKTQLAELEVRLKFVTLEFIPSSPSCGWTEQAPPRTVPAPQATEHYQTDDPYNSTLTLTHLAPTHYSSRWIDHDNSRIMPD